MTTSPRRPSRSTVVTTALTIGVFGAGAGLGTFLHDRDPQPRAEVLRLAAGTYQLDERVAESSSEALTARSLTGADEGSTLSGGLGGPPLCLSATVDWLAVQGAGEACASIPLLGKGTTSPPLLRPGNPAERSTPSQQPQEPKKSDRPDPAPKRSDPPEPTRMNEPRTTARPPAPQPPARDRDDSPAPRRSDPPATRKSEPEGDRKTENDSRKEAEKKADTPATALPKGTLRAVEPNAQRVPSGPPLQPVRPRPADQNRPDQNPPNQNPPGQTPPSRDPNGQNRPGQPRQNPTVNPPDQVPTARQPVPRVPTTVPTTRPTARPTTGPTTRPTTAPTTGPTTRQPAPRVPTAQPPGRDTDDRQCLVTGPGGRALRPAVAGGIAPGCEDPAQTALPTARPAPPTGRSAPPTVKSSPKATAKATGKPSQPSMPTSLRPAVTPNRPTRVPATVAATSGPRVPDGTTLRPATPEGESLPIFQDPALMRRAEEALGLDGTRTYTDANGEWDLTIAPPGTPECRDYSKQQLQAMGVSAGSPANLPRDSCLWPAFIRWLYADPAPGEVSNWTKFTGLPDRNLQLVVVDPNRGGAPAAETAPGVVEPDTGP
ncbi:hypothetical protein ACFSKW_00930 [Nonomuraea mangrovi]|uniref:Uncharacterized protein n=1 Tax=Nonomuraea mangrovi TaxID=2316207 RepID=A0ABW4SKP5_9ACTN